MQSAQGEAAGGANQWVFIPLGNQDQYLVFRLPEEVYDCFQSR